MLTVGAAAVGVLAAGQALAQSAECARLQAAIAAAPRGGAGASAASERQRGELASASAYAHSIGCDNQKFLFFGSEPPPQCGEIKGRIARMQANLAELQARAGGGRGDLVARYNAECVNAPPSRGPANIFEALFGGGARQAAINPDEFPPPDQQQQMIEKSIENEKKGANARRAPTPSACEPATAVSFRSPIPAPAAAPTASRKSAVRCARTPTCSSIRSRSAARSTQAVSTTGERYVDMPNALKFEQSFDSTCSCRRKGESWAQALAAAEARYGHELRDILVTPEKSAELSRPIIAKAAADPKAKPAKTNAKTIGQTPEAVAAQPGVASPQLGVAPSSPAGGIPVSVPERRDPGSSTPTAPIRR